MRAISLSRSEQRYRRFTVATTPALTTNVEKARGHWHAVGKNSLQRRCLRGTTLCLFLIASRTRDTRDSIHHTWNGDNRETFVTTNTKRQNAGTSRDPLSVRFIRLRAFQLSLSSSLLALRILRSLEPLRSVTCTPVTDTAATYHGRSDPPYLHSPSRPFARENSCTYVHWRGTHAAWPSPTGFFPATLPYAVSPHRFDRVGHYERAGYTSQRTNGEETPTRYLTLRRER